MNDRQEQGLGHRVQGLGFSGKGLDRQIDVQIDRLIYRFIDIYINRQIDRWIDRQ